MTKTFLSSFSDAFISILAIYLKITLKMSRTSHENGPVAEFTTESGQKVKYQQF